MAAATPEQRQRALAGQATLLRARVLDPMQAAWTELLRELDDERRRSEAQQARRARQDVQIALERHAARASVEPPRLDDGEAIAELERAVGTLADATNATIDALASTTSERLHKLAATFDRLVVQLHRWLGEQVELDASWRGPTPPAPASPPPAPASPAPPPEPSVADEPASTRRGGEPRAIAPVPEIPSWPPRIDEPPPPRAWWPVAERRVGSPWRHAEASSPSCQSEPQRGGDEWNDEAARTRGHDQGAA